MLTGLFQSNGEAFQTSVMDEFPMIRLQKLLD